MAVPFHFLVSDVFCFAGLLTASEGITGHHQVSYVRFDVHSGDLLGYCC